MSNIVPIDARGYGKIYKLVMRNKELPLLAKAIYAYFCAYAGSGTIAFPKRDKITRDLDINKDTYTKHLGKPVSLLILRLALRTELRCCIIRV